MFGDIGSYWEKYSEWIWDGVITTMEISLLSILLGLIIGLIIGFARNVHITRKDNKVLIILKKGLKLFLDGYIAFFRYTPFIAQAFFIHYVFFVHLDLFIMGTLALSFNTGAYIAMIVEGGIMSIDSGQYNAGRSLGLSHMRTYMTIVLPQAFKNMIPSLSNEFVNVIKATSVLSIIGIKDLLYWIDKGNGSSWDYAAGYTISIVIYFFICLSFMLIFKLVNWLLERRR